MIRLIQSISSVSRLPLEFLQDTTSVKNKKKYLREVIVQTNSITDTRGLFVRGRNSLNFVWEQAHSVGLSNPLIHTKHIKLHTHTSSQEMRINTLLIVLFILL